MGVLNVTPDSFSDGGAFLGTAAAVDHALRMLDAGADIVDIGGESTRPGSAGVSADEELGRVMPVIEALAVRGIGPCSIDTTKAEVARRAVEAGARLVNDISGLTFDEAMRGTVAELGVPVVISHTRGRPKEMQEGRIEYEGGVVASVREWLADAVEAACAAGIARDAIVVDPGIGFGKTVAHNLELLRSLERLKAIGCPVLVGTSRKAFIGALTQKEGRDRIFGTAASVALAVAHGADLVRVHDVEAMIDVVAVADGVVRVASVGPP